MTGMFTHFDWVDVALLVVIALPVVAVFVVGVIIAFTTGGLD